MIAESIERLGSDQYVERNLAEQRLESYGLEAYDALRTATGHADLEIATRAEHILQRLSVEWVQESDPPKVRSIMERYAAGLGAERLEAIEKLVRLKAGAGAAALCRITRFEVLPGVSLEAGLGVLEVLESPEARSSVDRDALLQAVGAGDSPGITWTRLALEGLAEPEQTFERWHEQIGLARSLLGGEGGPYRPRHVYRLMHYQLGVAALLPEIGRRAEALAQLAEFLAELEPEERPELPDGIRWWLELDDGTAPTELGFQIYWAFEREDWLLFKRIVEERSGEVQSDRFLTYLQAAGLARQGDRQAAEQIAQSALRLVADDAERRNEIATAMLDLGRVDWATQEWRKVIEVFPVTHLESMTARQQLANWWYHDRQQYRAGADLLVEFCDAVEATEDSKSRFFRELTKALGDSDRAVARWEVFNATREYTEACYQESIGNPREQEEHLDKAFGFDSWNPDILIAMYRVKDADAGWRFRVRGLIKKLSRALQTGIEAQLSSGHEDPQYYNLWAWLVSNTEGDFDKAVAYSRRSLELDPGNASYLDTLGRCYYAAGDLDSAIKYQKLAVERQPMVQIMRRQLKMFEDARAQQNRTEPTKPEDG